MTIREELEQQLGLAADYVFYSTDLGTLRTWAAHTGIDPAKAWAMTGTQLTNLYHELGPKSKASTQSVEDIVADALARVMVAMQPAPVDMDALRLLVREEVENVAPRRLEIVTPAGIQVLDGPAHRVTELVIKVASLGHPIMLVGPAGCGKTTIGEHVSQALGLSFYITSTVTDTHELMGFVNGMGGYQSTAFRNAFEHGGVWIADEIDAWDAAALLTANSALANGYATFPDMALPVRRHADFRMIATANTFGHGADRVYIGRNELDAASLDRFATIEVDYDAQLEEMFSGGNDEWRKRVQSVRRVCLDKNIRHVVSSRCIMMGAAALRIGIDRETTESIYLFKGMSKSDRSKIV